MGIVLSFGRHAEASTGAGSGRGISEGQGTSGQLSENHRIVRSRRRTWMSAPRSIAPNFFVSPMQRQLTVDKSKLPAAPYARATVNSCSIPVMDRISVILPDKSTAILPDAPHVDTGNTTAMDWGLVLRNIDRALDAAGRSADDVCQKAERPDAIRNLKRRHREGKGGWNHSVFSDVAKELGYSTEDLQRKDFEPRDENGHGDGFDVLRRFLLELRLLIEKQLASLPKRRR